MFIPLKMVLIGIDPYPYLYMIEEIVPVTEDRSQALYHEAHQTNANQRQLMSPNMLKKTKTETTDMLVECSAGRRYSLQK